MRTFFLIIVSTVLAVSSAVSAEPSRDASTLLPARPAGALTGPRILPVGEAFAVSALDAGETIEVRWLMPEGYYLYRHAFELRDEAGETRPFKVPEGIAKVDEFFGDVEVYYNEIVMAVPQQEAAGLTLRYQGCAELGYCYPPQKVSLGTLLPE